MSIKFCDIEVYYILINQWADLMVIDIIVLMQQGLVKERRGS